MTSILVRSRKLLFFVVVSLLLPVVASARPTARMAMQMVYYPKIQRIVLFGGMTGFDSGAKRQYFNDTWEFTGRRWIRQFPEHSPEKRSAYSMVYDSNRERVVLFGGTDGTNLFNDTWTFDGRDWTKLDPPSSPTPRRYAAAAFDPLRDRMVVFGGATNAVSSDMNDTWEFDGTTWTQVNTTGPKLRNAMATYDAARSEIVLVGYNIDSKAGETWHWKNGAWEKLSPTNQPSCVQHVGLTYEEESGKVLMHGGLCANSGLVSETNEWDGTNWTKVDTTAGTAGQVNDEALAYDPRRDEAIAFGGTNFGGVRGTTYRYRHGRWALVLTDFVSPGPRSLFVFGHDADQNVTWLFGGKNESGSFDDLWKLDGGEWQQVIVSGAPTTCIDPTGGWDPNLKKFFVVCDDSTTFEFDRSTWKRFDNLDKRPPMRRFVSTAYDETLKKFVTFGGYDDLSDYINETWLWDGTQWTHIDKKPHPPARSLAALFYDPVSKKTIMFGGIGRLNKDSQIIRYDDMWSFDGTQWTELLPATKPTARYGAQVAYDPIIGKVVMFGGKDVNENYVNEIWVWDGSTWAQVQGGNPPSARMNGRMVYDPATSRLTLYGGYAGQYFDELWLLDATTWKWELVPDKPSRRRALSRGASGLALGRPTPTGDGNQ